MNNKNIYDKIIGKYETKFIDFETTMIEINKNKPYYKPHKNPFNGNYQKYNNTNTTDTERNRSIMLSVCCIGVMMVLYNLVCCDSIQQFSLI